MHSNFTKDFVETLPGRLDAPLRFIDYCLSFMPPASILTASIRTSMYTGNVAVRLYLTQTRKLAARICLIPIVMWGFGHADRKILRPNRTGESWLSSQYDCLCPTWLLDFPPGMGANPLPVRLRVGQLYSFKSLSRPECPSVPPFQPFSPLSHHGYSRRYFPLSTVQYAFCSSRFT